MMFPQTKNDWWALAEENRDNLLAMVRRYHPASRTEPNPATIITAPAAEAALVPIRAEIAAKQIEEPAEAFARMMAARDPDLAELLGEVWCGIPESLGAHAIPSFGALCDLCSECYVLEEEPMR